MHRQFAAGAVVLIVACDTAALAQPAVWNGVLSRAQAIERAEIMGFDARMAAADAIVAQARVGEARAAVLPQVAVSGTATNANLPQLGMPVARQTYGSGNVSVPLVAPAGWANASAARGDADSSRFIAQMARNDAALAAAQAYDRAAFGAAVMQARAAAVTDQQENVRFAELMVRSGKQAAYTLARARAALAVAQQSEEDAAAEADEAVNDLKVLLDYDIASSLTISSAIQLRMVNAPLDALMKRAIAQRPDVLAARSALAAASARLRAARAQYLPVASISAQTYNGTSTPPLGTSGTQASVVVSLPILDGGSRSAGVHEAQASLSKSQLEYEKSQLAAQANVANAWREYQAAQRNLITAQTSLADADANLRVARLRRMAGKSTQLEVLDAISTTESAREMVLRAQQRLDVAVASVHHAAGDPSDTY